MGPGLTRPQLGMDSSATVIWVRTVIQGRRKASAAVLRVSARMGPCLSDFLRRYVLVTALA